MSAAIPQLLLVKYLFQRGQDVLAEKVPYSAGLAVSLFQDAIELMARTIADHVDANVSKNTSFDSLWDAIKSGRKNPEGKELPLKAKALAVNNARIGFKHYGNLPDPTHAARFGADTEQFLDLSCKDFLELEFKEISLIDLIQHKEASVHLHKARKAVVAGDSDTTLIECALAYHYLGAPIGILIPSTSRFRRGLSHQAQADRDLASLDANLEEISKSVSGLRSFTVASVLGISLFDYIRFQLVKPSLSVSMSGNYGMQLHGGRRPTVEDAEFALKFVTGYGIAVEKILAGLTDADRKQLFGRTLVPSGT